MSWISTWPGISAWSLLLWKIVLFVAVIREQVCHSNPLCGFRSAWSGVLRPFAASKTKLHGSVVQARFDVRTCSNHSWRLR